MTELTPALPKLLNRQELVTDIRLLISERWGLAVEYITLKSNFCDDLGLDCLEITELAVLIEQRFHTSQSRTMVRWCRWMISFEVYNCETVQLTAMI
jgi:acyl carrier protein